MALGVAALLGASCATHVDGTIPQRTPLTGCTGFQAGAATVELTPPPGFALGGFSIAGKMSRGRWAPLKARAIYLEDASCQSIVLISTDLMIMPNGLGDRLADDLGDDPATRHIGRENMLITATENHLSPGNYFTSKLYNTYSSRVDGFSPELFHWLTRRITLAVRAAVAAKEPAKLRSGQGTLDKFFRNRALPAFLRNREAVDFLAEAETSGAKCTDLPYGPHPLASREYFHELACLAVVPRIDVIDVVTTTGQRIALAGFLATHTTVLPASVEVYSADLLGLTALRMERGEVPEACNESSLGKFPVVALFNGAQGDVSTQWSTRDRGDLLALSNRVAKGLCKLLPGEEDASPTLAFQYEEVKPLNEVSFEDPFDGQKYKHPTPSVPDAGSAELGGASDGRTLFYELGHKEEMTSYRRTEHGSKIPPLSLDLGPARIAFGRHEFLNNPPPDAAPLTVMKVGQTVLVGVPGEMTTMMGERTRRFIEKQNDIATDEQVIVGFGNGHVSYFPTTEEYDAQWYEGASDYYGPGTGSYLATRLSKLAGGLTGESTKLPEREYDYEVGKEEEFRARHVGHPAYHPDDGLTRITSQLAPIATLEEPTPPNPIIAQPELRTPRRDYPTWCFLDALPSLEDVVNDPADGCLRNYPEVAVHEADAATPAVVAGRIQDDQGGDLITILATAGEDRGEWCAIWLAPVELDAGLATNLDKKYEFRARGITEAGITTWKSPTFTIADGFDQSAPESLVCSDSLDAGTVGGVFVERASCEPLPRPDISEFFPSLGASGVTYCESPPAASISGGSS